MSDKIVFDIETKNTFDDVNSHIPEFNVSVVGVYSYVGDAYTCFDEYELDKVGELLKHAHLLVGFSSKRFDLPILQKYFKFNLSAIPHFDILEEVEKNYGRRIGLGILAEANLGMGKSGKGLDAIEYYKNGEMEKLKAYCIQDVRITKELYELIKKQGYLWIPDRNSAHMAKVEFHYKEIEPSPQTRLV